MSWLGAVSSLSVTTRKPRWDEPSDGRTSSQDANTRDLSLPPEIPVEKPKIADSIASDLRVPVATLPGTGRPLKLAEIMGRHSADALLIKGFMPEAKGALAVLTRLASKPGGGIAAVKRLAGELREGIAGAGHQNRSRYGVTMLFPDLPRGFVVTHSYAETVAGLNKLIDDLSVLAEIDKHLKAEKPHDPTREALRIWRERKVPPAPVMQATPPIAHTLPGPDLSAFRKTEDATPYRLAGPPDAHFAPLYDDDIIVCGQVIYKKGSETWDIFVQVYAAYGYFDLVDRDMARLDNVAARGYQWRRISPWLCVASPVFGAAIWNIGNAMANHSDRWEERSAPPKVPNAK